jgi:hypothetical protein
MKNNRFGQRQHGFEQFEPAFDSQIGGFAFQVMTRRGEIDQPFGELRIDGPNLF